MFGDPISMVDPCGRCADEANSENAFLSALSDFGQEIKEYAQNTFNSPYNTINWLTLGIPNQIKKHDLINLFHYKIGVTVRH